MDSEIEPMNESKLPIFYSEHYNIKFCGMEKLHAFDSCKWRRIVTFLTEKTNGLINIKRIHEPEEATRDELLIGHTEEYLESLRWSSKVARILEVVFVACVPNFLLQRYVLRPFRHQVKGTMMAAKMAMDKNWAINIGGGFHHAHKQSGGGFCVYADISIAIKALKAENPEYKFLIVDLDAHQGNGHERDFPNGTNVYILDLYNKVIYPHDEEAKHNIDVNVPLMSWTNDTQYMEILKENLDRSFDLVTPNLIVYNAGTDCLTGDPLGRLDITADGIRQRDELMFEEAKKRKIPIVMVTSGGYQMSNAAIIADSIVNLFNKKIIQ